jgi:hypothetical protein
MSRNLGGGSVAKSAYSDELLSDVSGILLLLRSAKLSLQSYAVGDACIESLSKCIGRIQEQYKLTEVGLKDGIVWKEATIDGILRLLDYVEAEVREKLDDRKSADEVRLCIDRLTSSQRLSHERWDLKASSESASPWSASKPAHRCQ